MIVSYLILGIGLVGLLFIFLLILHRKDIMNICSHNQQVIPIIQENNQSRHVSEIQTFVLHPQIITICIHPDNSISIVNNYNTNL